MNKEIEDANKQLRRLFKERGSKALELARKTVLEEKIESKQVREALRYFMMERWYDTARPGLLSVVCESVGGKPEDMMDVAIPLILIGGATDIHDDIIDESKTKYNRPTVYGKFGKEIAILAGDALFFKGLSMLNISCTKHPQIMNIIKNMFFELGDAEALELQFRKKTTVAPEVYLAIIRKKAADVEAHTRIGAMIGGGTEKEIEVLGEYGRLLGMLIILKDDYIDSLEYEEIKHRIQKEHFPMPLLYALKDQKAKTTISEILQKTDIKKKDVHTIEKLIQSARGFQETTKLMENLLEAAEKQITKIKNNTCLKLMLHATKV
jgi:geranylgeranyl pyrophosphate synthase